MFENEEIDKICRKYLLVCPICETENTHNRLKRDIVRPIVTEGDGHPLENKWGIVGYEHINPLEFFWGFCNKCFFAGELESAEFRQAERNLVAYRSLLRTDAIDKLKAAASTPDTTTYSLSLRLGSADPAVAIIARFYLGIFSHLQMQKIVPGSIARYYLRIAWIFRDLEKYYPKSSLKNIRGSFRKVIKRFDLEIPEENDYPIKPALVLGEKDALRYAKSFFERNFQMLREAGLEDELRLTNLLAEISFRIYELSSTPEDFKVSSSFYSAVIQKCLGIISDKSVAGGSVNRARQLLDVAGDRGRELRQLNKDITSGKKAVSKSAVEEILPSVDKKAKTTREGKNQSNNGREVSKDESNIESPINKGDLKGEDKKTISPDLTLDEAKKQLVESGETIVALNGRVKELEDSLKRWRHVAGRDQLTSLPNKNSLLRLTMPKALKSLKADEARTCYGILFQQIAPMNIRYGWGAGDQALKSTAIHLKGLLNEGEELFRLDGAIFGIWSSASLNMARPRSAEFRRRFSKGSIKVGEGEMSLQSSIGIVTVEKVVSKSIEIASGKVFAALMNSIYHARDDGGNTVHIHSSHNF